MVINGINFDTACLDLGSQLALKSWSGNAQEHTERCLRYIASGNAAVAGSFAACAASEAKACVLEIEMRRRQKAPLMCGLSVLLTTRGTDIEGAG